MRPRIAIGARLWDRLYPSRRPAELHEFPPIVGRAHTAPSTPGDLLFHIRAERHDLCFEFERLLFDALGDAVTVVDETNGFRYFDARDLLGFVDGTANPVGADLAEASLIGDEDPAFAGGSYVVIQKYLHDLTAWGHLTTEAQEAVIGRRKIDNVELDDGPGPSSPTRPWPPSSVPTVPSSRSCGTTCPSAAPATASSAPTSSATPVGCGSPS